MQEEEEGEGEEKVPKRTFRLGAETMRQHKAKAKRANVRCGQNERLKTRTCAVGLRCRLRCRLELELGAEEQK